MDQRELEEQESAEDSTAAASSVAKVVPRLRIAHLLLWTLFSALFLTISQGIRTLENEPDSFSSMMDASGVLYGIIFGIVMTGAVVLVAARISDGPPLCSQPGHWLVVVQAISYTLILPVWAYSTWAASFGFQFSFLLYGLINLCEVAGYTLACFHMERGRWSSFFAASALLSFAQGFMQIGVWSGLVSPSLWAWLITLSTYSGVLLCLWLLLVVWQDKREHRSRDWIHWTGIFSLWASVLLSLAWTLVTQIMLATLFA